MFPPFGLMISHGRKLFDLVVDGHRFDLLANVEHLLKTTSNKKQTTTAHPSHLKSTKRVL